MQGFLKTVTFEVDVDKTSENHRINQAGDDVFRDRELGENHRQTEEALTVSGVINGGGAKKITQVMDFHGFTVYQDDDACANILSQGKAVDNGDDYEYDRKNDCHVLGPLTNGKIGPIYRFDRLTESDGTKSRHYGCNMLKVLRNWMAAKAAEATNLVVSVADSRKEYSKRQQQLAGRHTSMIAWVSPDFPDF